MLTEISLGLKETLCAEDRKILRLDKIGLKYKSLEYMRILFLLVIKNSIDRNIRLEPLL